MPSSLSPPDAIPGPDAQQIRLTQMADALRSQLTVLIDPTQLPLRLSFLRSLRPTASDYARVFVGESSTKAQAFYEAMWQQPMQPSWNPLHTRIRLHVALPEDFASGHPRAEAFPAGYRSIAAQLVPGIPWACFELLEAGDTLGVSTDGLLRLDDRLLWFPRPYVALT